MLGIYLGTMTNHIKKIGIAGWGFNADYRSKSNLALLQLKCIQKVLFVLQIVFVQTIDGQVHVRGRP